MQGLFAGFEVVVVDFDAEYYGACYGGYGVGDNQRPVAEHYALDYEEYAAEPEEQKRGHGYTVGIAGAYRIDGLRQVAAHHADGGKIAYDVYGYIHGEERLEGECRGVISRAYIR